MTDRNKEKRMGKNTDSDAVKLAVEWTDSSVCLYTTGNRPFDMILARSKDSGKGKIYEEIARRWNAAEKVSA
jgi:hypothetical protein